MIRPPILVNESDDKNVKGPLYIFDSEDELTGYLEPWYVDENYYAFDIGGQPLTLVASDDAKVSVKIADGAKDPKLVRKYLEASGMNLEIPEAVMQPLSNEALATYIKNYERPKSGGILKWFFGIGKKP